MCIVRGHTKGKCENVNYEDIPHIQLRRDRPYNFIIVLKRDDISLQNINGNGKKWHEKSRT